MEQQNQQQEVEVKDINIVNIYRDQKDGRKVINNFKVCKRIGEGAFGKVKLVYQIQEDEFYAFKKFNKNLLQKKSKIVKQENGDVDYKTMWETVENEIAIHRQLHHDNILQLYQIITNEEQGKVYMVLEYAYSGDVLLWDEKKQIFYYDDPRKNTDYNFIQNIMRGCLLGLKYLHEKNIVHRDIKPQNILVNAGEIAKICDFGTAKQLKPDERLRGTEGTYHFMAPETLKDMKQNGFCGKQADIFSLGVTFYCLVYRDLPFKNANLMELFNQIQKKEPQFKEGPPIQLIEIIKQMMTKNPNNRINIDQILSDPWFDIKYPVIDYDGLDDEDEEDEQQQQQQEQQQQIQQNVNIQQQNNNQQQLQQQQINGQKQNVHDDNKQLKITDNILQQIEDQLNLD